MIAHATLPNAILVLCAGSLIQLLAMAWRRHAARDAIIGIFILIGALIATFIPSINYLPGKIVLFAHDSWGSFFSALILVSTLVIVGMTRRQEDGDEGDISGEYYLLLNLAAMGAISMANAYHDSSFFLGLETLSLSLLGLIAFHPAREKSAEAAMKYLVLSAVASASLLFGLALIYHSTGSLLFAAPALGHVSEPAMAVIGIILVLAGMFFKLSAVPFHLWLSDILEGASLPIAAFVAVVSKIALFAAMVRYFAVSLLLYPGIGGIEIAIVAGLSMLGGNLLALMQTDLRRMMAGSSIAHVGYVLVALLSPIPFGWHGAAFYLLAYALATLGVFAMMNAVMPEGSDMRAWQGMYRKHPFIAGLMSIMLISLAGIPPAVGFFAKFYVVVSGATAGHAFLLLVLVASSVAGLFYYLRVVAIMLTPSPVTAMHDVRCAPMQRSGIFLASVLALMLLVAGFWPNLFVRPTWHLNVISSAEMQTNV